MCAIAGIFDKSGKLGGARIAQLAKQAAERMSHRGPDDCGVWVSPDGQCALSHRRLSIVDTSFAGHQPMVAPDGLGVIVFNGEIYNFLELRAELQSKGELFRSRSDTEVLLSLLQREGPRI
jgi:asparagine synthase (glutamine-hydrolysing)